MSKQIRRGIALVQEKSTSLALNPLLTGALLWALTKGPPGIRERLIRAVTSLQDPQRLGSVVKVLKGLLVLGLVARGNRALNQIALNAWRVKGEKMRWEWNKEVAVVTGGCSGIGELIVQELEKKGVRVAVLDIQQLPPSLQDHARIKFFACDITDPSAVRDAAESIRSTLGAPSILVNNAGIAQGHTILNTSDEFLIKLFGVNLLSNWYTVKAFLPDMISKNKGHVVTIASLASFTGVAGMVDYCSTKAGVLAFHEGLAQELKHAYKAPNIMTTSVHPSWVRTPLVETFAATFEKTGTHLIKPQRVADAVVNQIFTCNGGQLIIPEKLSSSTGMRGWPNWMQERVRDHTSRLVMSGQKDGKPGFA